VHGRGLATALAVAFLALPADAFAYIDPAAGSIILQVLIGGVTGILVITKLYFRKLKTFFGRRPRDTASRAHGDPPAR
jgi:hypothetical protein